jgi:ABC-2 type transport system ATP-binding protein
METESEGAWPYIRWREPERGPVKVMIPAIEIQNLTKRYRIRRTFRECLRAPFGSRWTTVVDSVNFEIAQGELFGLLGPNGAGKTTLVKLLSTLVLPTSGTAIVNGWDVTRNIYAVRRSIGYCMDTERSFFFRLTGAQNLEFFAALNDVGARTKERIAEVTDLLRLGDVIREPFMSYSSGTRQKLGLARALLNDPPVLILDEPTRGMDPAAAEEFRWFIRGSLVDRFRKTILLVTHNMEEAESCDRVAVMSHGRIVALGRDDAVRMIWRKPELQGVGIA